MKREIKFRGKSEDNNEWVYGYFVDLNDGKEPNIFGDHNDFYPVIPETVGQFTGIKDCKGQDIYEGDIISINGEHEKIVQYVDKEYGFCVANISDLPNARWMYVWRRPAQNWWNDFNRKIEVIGNITDNPELLNNNEL